MTSKKKQENYLPVKLVGQQLEWLLTIGYRFFHKHTIRVVECDVEFPHIAPKSSENYQILIYNVMCQ